MATYYVKSGGDGSAPTTDPTTNSWATAYDNITGFETGVGNDAGDIVKISHLHNKSNASNQIWTLGGTAASPIVLISVDDSDVDVYRPGATEDCSGGVYDIQWDNGAGTHNIFYGIDFLSGDNLSWDPGITSTLTFYDCNFNISDTALSSDQIVILNDGGFVEWFNCNLTGRSSVAIAITHGCHLRWTGGSFSGQAALPDPTAFIENSANGGATGEITNVDFSGMASGASLVSAGDSTGTDVQYFKFYNCILPASFSLVTGGQDYNHPPVELFNCQVVDGQRVGYAMTDKSGTMVSVEGSSSAGIYRTDGTEVSTGIWLSAQATTTSTASKYFPLRFLLGSRYEDDYATNGSVRVYLVSTAMLNDAEVWIEAFYQDGTNSEATLHAVGGAQSNSHRNPLATGTTLTTDSSSDWNNGPSDLTSYNEYYIDLALTSGGDGLVEVYACVGDPSVVVYFDTEFDFV